MELEKIRKEIDSIDKELLKLLNQRLELGLRTKRHKKHVYDKTRETQILEQLLYLSRSYNLIKPAFVEKLFKAILVESRETQKENKPLIGFQGEHGAFGEVAAKVYDPNLVPIPCDDFADVFEGVELGTLDQGIVPVENSAGGAITQVNELLIKTGLKIVGAVKLRIDHCLLQLPESSWRQIRVVYSHPQALTQCRGFLSRNKLEARPFYDTAGAAKMLARDKPKMAAAIASKLCAELYNLEVVKLSIQDFKNNFTRFLILAKRERKDSSNKCSIIFSTAHRVGTLFSVLKIFVDEQINLTRIESIPDRDDPGNYIFFLEFQKQGIQNQVQRTLEKVRQKTSKLKYLGCYTEEMTE